MKKLLLILFAGVICISPSCDKVNGLFGKSGKKSTEALVAENEALQQQLAEETARHEQEMAGIRSEYENKLVELQKQIDAGTVKEFKVYYVVVGSFKQMENATNYSEKIKAMGYEGKIVEGPNQFNLVTSGTFQTLRSALAPLGEAREKLASEAWVYFRN
jgi:cell division protein FtsN